MVLILENCLKCIAIIFFVLLFPEEKLAHNTQRL